MKWKKNHLAKTHHHQCHTTMKIIIIKNIQVQKERIISNVGSWSGAVGTFDFMFFWFFLIFFGVVWTVEVEEKKRNKILLKHSDLLYSFLSYIRCLMVDGVWYVALLCWTKGYMAQHKRPDFLGRENSDHHLFRLWRD